MKKQGSKIDDKLNGIYQEFYENGTKKLLCFYDKGVLNGIYEEYYPNSESKFKYELKDDLKGNIICLILEGYCTSFRENSSIEHEGYYVKGKKHGQGKTYYDNFMLEYEGEFINDSKLSSGQYYNQNGDKINR